MYHIILLNYNFKLQQILLCWIGVCTLVLSKFSLFNTPISFHWLWVRIWNPDTFINFIIVMHRTYTFNSEHHHDLFIFAHIQGATQCLMRIQNTTCDGYDGWWASLLMVIFFQHQHTNRVSWEAESFCDSTKQITIQ